MADSNFQAVIISELHEELAGDCGYRWRRPGAVRAAVSYIELGLGTVVGPAPVRMFGV
jgi:hypothetical protein